MYDFLKGICSITNNEKKIVLGTFIAIKIMYD